MNAGVIGRAAGHDINPLEVGQIPYGQADVVQNNAAIPDPGADGVPDSLGLLMNLLEHEVLVAAFFCGGHLPGDVLRLLDNGFSMGVIEPDAAVVHHQQIPVIEIHHIPGVL